MIEEAVSLDITRWEVTTTPCKEESNLDGPEREEIWQPLVEMEPRPNKWELVVLSVTLLYRAWIPVAVTAWDKKCTLLNVIEDTMDTTTDIATGTTTDTTTDIITTRKRKVPDADLVADGIGDEGE